MLKVGSIWLHSPVWIKNPRQNGGGCIIDHTVQVADIIRPFPENKGFRESAESQRIRGRRVGEGGEDENGV